MKRMPLVALALATVVLAGCSASAAPRETPEPTPPPTPTPTARAVAWSAAFEEGLCLAFAVNAALSARATELSEEAAVLDFAAVSETAYSIGADLEVIQAVLQGLPDWRPARQLVGAWLRAAELAIRGMDSIDRGATLFDPALIRRGGRQMESATEALAAMTRRLVTFMAETGFYCP